MAKDEPGDQNGHQDDRRDIKALFSRKLAETHLYFEIGKIIASELEPSDLVQKITEVIRNVISFQDVSVHFLRKDLTGFEPFHTAGPLFAGVSLETISIDNGAPGTMLATGDSLFLNDTSRFSGYLHFPQESRKPGSYMGILLKSDARSIGTMGFSHPDAGAFRTEDFDILRTTSLLISTGIEKAELFKKTLELSRIDELTGLFNYRVMMEKLAEEMHRRARSRRDFSFIMIDIDDFKRINDRYGHLEGSRVIAQMGPVLRASCRAGSLDACFRYGGEEFSILLPETSMKEALVVAERVRHAVEANPFSLKATHPEEKVTVSIGVSTIEDEALKKITEIIHESDVALYRSKAAGKNRVTCYSAGDTMPASGAPEVG